MCIYIPFMYNLVLKKNCPFVWNSNGIKILNHLVSILFLTIRITTSFQMPTVFVYFF